MFPATAFTLVSKISVPAELVIETATFSAAGDVMFTVPVLFCSGICVDCTVTCCPTIPLPWITSLPWVS